MKILLKSASCLGLGLTVLPAFFVFDGSMSFEEHAWLMVLGMLLWFLTAPFWMVQEDDGDLA